MGFFPRSGGFSVTTPWGYFVSIPFDSSFSGSITMLRKVPPMLFHQGERPCVRDQPALNSFVLDLERAV
jgi:hypothetical protein